MNIIKFNNSEFEVESYNKSTYFSLSGSMNSNASCSLVAANVNTLMALALEPITSIQIEHDQKVIYTLNNITCHITNMNEYLSNDRMSVSLNLSFEDEQAEEEPNT